MDERSSKQRFKIKVYVPLLFSGSQLPSLRLVSLSPTFFICNAMIVTLEPEAAFYTKWLESMFLSSWSATNGHRISFPFTLSLAIVTISFLSPLFLPLCSPVSKKRCRTRWNGKESYSVGPLANENSFGQGLPEYDFVNGAFYTYTRVHESIRILIFHETYVCNKYFVISIYIVQIGLELCQHRRNDGNEILKCRA